VRRNAGIAQALDGAVGGEALGDAFAARVAPLAGV